jgi:hypothetical protein
VSLSACIHRCGRSAVHRQLMQIAFGTSTISGTMIASHVGHRLLAGMGLDELQLAAGDTYRKLTP